MKINIQKELNFFSKKFLGLYLPLFLAMTLILYITIHINNVRQAERNSLLSLKKLLNPYVKGNDAISIYKTINTFKKSIPNITICLTLPNYQKIHSTNCDHIRQEKVDLYFDERSYFLGLKINLFNINTAAVISIFLLIITILLYLSKNIQRVLNQVKIDLFKVTQEGHHDFNTIEIEKLYLQLKEKEFLKSQLQEFVLSNEVLESTRKVAHDIRFPLSVLKHSLPHSFEFKHSLEALTNISERILHKTKKVKTKKLNLHNMINDLKKLKKTRYPFVEIRNGLKETVSVKAHQSELECIFSNFINNSIEAGANQIIFKTSHEQSFEKVMIKDNGSGFPLNFLNSFGHKEVISHKETGNGIALLYAQKYLKSIGASIQFENDDGAKISISFPKSIEKNENETSHHSSHCHILLDDDPLVRAIWQKEAKNKAINLITYSDPQSLLKSTHKFPKNTSFYIDYYLDKQTSGDDVIQYLTGHGFTNLSICSALTCEETPNTLSHLPHIGKEPPWSETLIH